MPITHKGLDALAQNHGITVQVQDGVPQVLKSYSTVVFHWDDKGTGQPPPPIKATVGWFTREIPFKKHYAFLGILSELHKIVAQEAMTAPHPWSDWDSMPVADMLSAAGHSTYVHKALSWSPEEKVVADIVADMVSGKGATWNAQTLSWDVPVEKITGYTLHTSAGPLDDASYEKADVYNPKPGKHVVVNDEVLVQTTQSDPYAPLTQDDESDEISEAEIAQWKAERRQKQVDAIEKALDDAMGAHPLETWAIAAHLYDTGKIRCLGKPKKDKD